MIRFYLQATCVGQSCIMTQTYYMDYDLHSLNELWLSLYLNCILW